MIYIRMCWLYLFYDFIITLPFIYNINYNKYIIILICLLYINCIIYYIYIFLLYNILYLFHDFSRIPCNFTNKAPQEEENIWT